MPLNLKLSWKLALIGICSTVPLLCGTYYLINKYTNKDIRFAVLEQYGNRFLRPVVRNQKRRLDIERILAVGTRQLIGGKNSSRKKAYHRRKQQPSQHVVL